MTQEKNKVDSRIQKYTNLFKLSWDDVVKNEYFKKANDALASYNQAISSSWSTISEVTLGEAKKMVDQALPILMQYIFNGEPPFELIPGNKDISPEQLLKMRKFLIYQMNDVMNLEKYAMFTLKDAIKFGNGYAIIEPKEITPPNARQVSVLTTGGSVNRPIMEVGESKTILSYNRLPFGSVVPTPDGVFPDEVSCVFVMRYYNEAEFRGLMEQEMFEGNTEAIIDKARDVRFNGYFGTMREKMAELAGNSLSTPRRMRGVGGDDNTPVLIPVMQCYAPDEHLYFACDDTVIYHNKNKVETLRNPVINVKFDPEPEQWFSPGIINPRLPMIDGVETFFNALMDILTFYLHPTQIVSKEALVNANESPEAEPYSVIEVIGDANSAIRWATPPDLPSGLIGLGDKLSEFKDSSAGQPAALYGQGQAGMVRGGSGAMESLFQNSTGREKLTGQNIETSWYKDIVYNTMIMSQLLADEEFQFPFPVIDRASGEKSYKFENITIDEIRRIYGIKLTFKEKMRNKLADASIRQATYDRLIQRQDINRERLDAYLLGDEDLSDELHIGVDQQRNEQLMARENQSGEQGDQGGMPGAEGAGMAGGGLNI